jgi:preprotein translocase subunit SecF
MPLLRFLPEATNINFVGARYVAFAIDGLLLLASIISIAVHGFNLGIDFTGGVSLEVKSAQHIDIGQLRGQVDSLGFKETQIQYVGGGQCETPPETCALIRVQPQSDEANEAAARKIKDKLGSGYTIRSTNTVGPKVSSELFRAGVIATLLAVLAIGGWVAVRFEWQYGISAAIATGHDVLVTAGLYSILHLDFTLTSIAALLTLAGYSINDTVVVFDRIRENRRKYKRMSLPDLINLSTNQMLTRTILTSVATAVSIVPLLIYGGPSLRDFSAAILFGIVVGTFSSIYVAAALLLYLPAPAGSIDAGSAAEASA